MSTKGSLDDGMSKARGRVSPKSGIALATSQGGNTPSQAGRTSRGGSTVTKTGSTTPRAGSCHTPIPSSMDADTICGANKDWTSYAPSDEEENANATDTADEDMSWEEANEVAKLEDAQEEEGEASKEGGERECYESCRDDCSWRSARGQNDILDGLGEDVKERLFVTSREHCIE